MADVYLDIVNENDEIIDKALRSEIHDKGLLHREIHVWFVTPDKKVIFQKRAANKDTYPNLLDATAGGHVELGASYAETALAEVLEETGIQITASEIYYIDKVKSNAFDNITGKTNHAYREVYGYIFKGNTNDLVIEGDAGAGFKAVSLEDIYNPTPELISEIIGGHVAPERQNIFKALEKLVA